MDTEVSLSPYNIDRQILVVMVMARYRNKRKARKAPQQIETRHCLLAAVWDRKSSTNYRFLLGDVCSQVRSWPWTSGPN